MRCHAPAQRMRVTAQEQQAWQQKATGLLKVRLTSDLWGAWSPLWKDMPAPHPQELSDDVVAEREEGAVRGDVTQFRTS
jgi:hypothetical protein